MTGRIQIRTRRIEIVIEHERLGGQVRSDTNQAGEKKQGETTESQSFALIIICRFGFRIRIGKFRAHWHI